MKKWTEKNWLYMLLNQGEFEAVIDDCGVRISDCLATFTVSALVMFNVLLTSIIHLRLLPRWNCWCARRRMRNGKEISRRVWTQIIKPS